MSSITDQKQYILQSIFRNKLLEHELKFYTNGSTIISYNGEELLCSSKQKKIFLILQGYVQVKGNDEPVTTLSSGFIGLSFLFPDTLWQKYQGYSTCGLQVLCLDILVVQDMMKKFPAFPSYFFQRATELDLILLHYYSTKNDLSKRASLSSVVSSLEQLSFESGIYDASILKEDKSSLILYSGDLMHTSGTELVPGVIYNCTELPDDGEWVNSGATQLFYEGNASNNLLNLNKTKRLEASKEKASKQVNSLNATTTVSTAATIPITATTTIDATINSTNATKSIPYSGRFRRYSLATFILLFFTGTLIAGLVFHQSAKFDLGVPEKRDSSLKFTPPF
jgi:hypothetical protein